MAHKKGVGSSKNGRESESKRLGVKIFGTNRTSLSSRWQLKLNRRERNQYLPSKLRL